LRNYEESEWVRLINLHPHRAEGKREVDSESYWDQASENYNDKGYLPMAEEITKHLKDTGILNSNASMAEIGPGTGTFTKRMCDAVRNITCMDVSKKFLQHLEESCAEENISNLIFVHQDWKGYVPNKEHDIVFTALCPVVNNPESILKMEECAKGWCIYVSSIIEDGSVHSEVWKRLGKEYTYAGHDTHFPYEFLKKHGRSPELIVFPSKRKEIPVEQAMEMEKKMFESFDYDVDEMIEEIVLSRAENGMVKTMKRSLGLLIWKPVMQ
jgi:Phospholipid N-methyltransferase